MSELRGSILTEYMRERIELSQPIEIEADSEDRVTLLGRMFTDAYRCWGEIVGGTYESDDGLVHEVNVWHDHYPILYTHRFESEDLALQAIMDDEQSKDLIENAKKHYFDKFFEEYAPVLDLLPDD